MSDSLEHGFKLPPEQQAIRDKCFHPSGTFVEFTKEEIEQSIPERFEKIVKMNPERLAVKMGSQSLTYGQLNQASNRIARSILESRNPGSEPVAFLLDHGVNAVAALLGVLKAGKCFVAIDPTFSAQRVANILMESRPVLIVTDSRSWKIAQWQPSLSRSTLLNVDTIDTGVNSTNLGQSVGPHDDACILFTSGSTGKPKGVVVSHRSMLQCATLNESDISVYGAGRFSSFHSLSFGSSHVQLFEALLHGASLILFDLRSEGVRRLATWLAEEQINVFHSPPALFRELTDILPEHEKLPHLRLIRLSGAPVMRSDFERYVNNFSPESLLEISMGSTEARWVGSVVVDRCFTFPKHGTPIGFSAPGRNILLLDDKLNEVGPGEVGEIAVKSRYLAAGYWNHPELTAAKFLLDPSGGDERIYLTGDLGRMLPDGFLIYLGRKEFMVKIRGYRVEIGEIERALLAHRLIKDAGVVAWEREVGEKYLAAYIVPQTKPGPRIDDLRAFLIDRLPDYMLPSAFVFLESLPLTNGKLDRAALPKPEGKRPEVSQAYVAPRNEVEQELVQIWEKILDVRPIGIHDNFFDLGGHSLAASRVISRVIQKFNLELPVRALFDAPTVAEMAAVIAQNQAKRASDGELAQMLCEVDAMTDAEAQKQLARESVRSSKGDGDE